MFFKARSQIFFGISKKKFIHHNRYLQNDHQKIFLVKKKLIFNFFLTFFLLILLANFFYKKVFINGHFEGNNYDEYFSFSKFQKKILDWALKTIVLDVS